MADLITPLKVRGMIAAGDALEAARPDQYARSFDSPQLPVPNEPQESSTAIQAATRCLRAAQELRKADADVDIAEQCLRAALTRQEQAAGNAHAAALDLVRATSAATDRA